MKLIRRLAFGALILFTFPFLIALRAEFGSIEEFLIWVVSGGGAVLLAGAVVALLFENWSAWHDFPTWVKISIPIIIAAIIGTVAQLALALGLPAMIPPWLATLILMMLGWLGSQWQYMRAKEKGYGAG